MLLLIVTLISAPLRLWAADVRTIKQEGVWISEGTFMADGWFSRARETLSRLDTYNRWALKGIDGQDPVSAAYWEHLKRFDFQAPATMILVYDINLGWPFGSTGNTLKFQVLRQTGNPTILRLEMLDRPLALEAARLVFTMESLSPQAQDPLSLATPGPNVPAEAQNPATVDPGPAVDHGRISFRLELKIGWLIDALMDQKGYQAHMNELMDTMTRNLVQYCQTPGANDVLAPPHP